MDSKGFQGLPCKAGELEDAGVRVKGEGGHVHWAYQRQLHFHGNCHLKLEFLQAFQGGLKLFNSKDTSPWWLFLFSAATTLCEHSLVDAQGPK